MRRRSAQASRSSRPTFALGSAMFTVSLGACRQGEGASWPGATSTPRPKQSGPASLPISPPVTTIDDVYRNRELSCVDSLPRRCRLSPAMDGASRGGRLG